MALCHCDQTECESLSTALIRELPEGTPPVYNSIEPYALDALFGDRKTRGVVAFEHAGYTIIVRSTGKVFVEED